MATFSIIVPTFDRPARLATCLQALAQLDYPQDSFEVIVVDDGSPTPPTAIVDGFCERLRLTFWVQSHAGPAAARNAGAAQATGEYLAFTDDDCAPDPNWLNVLLRYLQATPGCAVGGQTLNALAANPYSTASQDLVAYLYAQFNAGKTRSRFLTSNNLALPADRFSAIGGFDNYFPFAAAEDRDFCDRWLHAGYPLVEAPEAVVYHSHHLTPRSFWRQHFNYGRGAYHFYRLRAARQAGPVRWELPTFYLKLLGHPFQRLRRHNGLPIALLTLASQLANASGYFYERWSEHDAPRR